MPKIVRHTSYSSDTGFALGAPAYKRKHGTSVNSLPFPVFGTLFLADSSSPIPNMRPPEILLALITLARTSALLFIRTFVGCGGTAEQYLGAWITAPLGAGYWRRFYADTKIMERIPLRYAPVSWYIYLLAFVRKLLVLILWLPFTFVNPLRTLTVWATFGVGIFEWKHRNLKLKDLRTMLNSRQVAIQIPCPICSYQRKETVFHAIVAGYGKSEIMKDALSTGQAKCNASAILRAKMEDLTLWDLTFRLGGKISGALAFALMNLTKSNIAIRDYSKRGETLVNLIKVHGKNLWITSRFYLKSGEHEMKNMLGLFFSILFLFFLWIPVFKKYPLLSKGDEIEIQM